MEYCLNCNQIIPIPLQLPFRNSARRHPCYARGFCSYSCWIDDLEQRMKILEERLCTDALCNPPPDHA